MSSSSSQKNIESLTIISHRLGELLREVTFIGGGIIGLLITDKAAPDVRFTVDVDCIIDVITHADYYALAKKLRSKGFKEIVTGSHPLCRWDCDGILVDIMPTDKRILGFSNRWYKEALEYSKVVFLSEKIRLNIISAPYFLATKLEAFKDRGQQDFLLSHDIEDIVSLLDGRSEIIDDLSLASSKLREYLASEFTSLINNERFLQALPGHLNYSDETYFRQGIVMQRINALIAVGD